MDIKILDFIEGMYARKLSDKEVLVLDEMLENETLESFKKKYELVLARKVEYFTPAKMQQLINNRKEIDDWCKSVGIKSLDELYEN